MSKQYDDYIKEHRFNVYKAWSWLSDHHIIEQRIYQGILSHDMSKYDPEEYDAYDKYFYGEQTTEVKDAFNHAWLHHIHANPHHWQYWVLIEDDGERKPIGLMIPYEYVVEMICDWWSFSFKKGDLYEIFNWYEQHKGRMILHENTRELVEEILADIRKALDQEKEK